MESNKFLKRQLNFWHYILPTLFFILSVYLIISLEYPLDDFTDWLLWISRMDPFLLIAYGGSTNTVPTWAWLPILVLLITAVVGRVFCGWVCPVGGLLGILDNIKRCFPRYNVSLQRKAPACLAQLKYLWMLIVLVALFLGSSTLLIFTPSAILSHEAVRLYHEQIPWIFIAAFILGLIFFPRFWCVYVCPSGILMSAIASLRPVKIHAADNCVNCGLCNCACPVQAIKGNKETAGGECLVCGSCWSVCPINSVKWQLTSTRNKNSAKNRRAFIAAGIGIVGAGFLSSFATAIFQESRASAKALRPPGALPEDEFLATCNRCGRCIKVCPSEGLVPMPLEKGLLNFDTPNLIPRKGRCELCMLCPKVCPTGALQDVAVKEVAIGTAAVNEKKCLAWAEGKLCLVCAEQCPVHAVVMDQAKRPRIDAEKCIGCGACENSCPVEEPAVVVTPKYMI